MKKIGIAFLSAFGFLLIAGGFFVFFVGALQAIFGHIRHWPFAIPLATAAFVLCCVGLNSSAKRSKDQPAGGWESLLTLKPLTIIALILISMICLGCFSLGFEALAHPLDGTETLWEHSLTWLIWSIMTLVVFPRWRRNRRLKEEAEEHRGAMQSSGRVS